MSVESLQIGSFEGSRWRGGRYAWGWNESSVVALRGVVAGRLWVLNRPSGVGGDDSSNEQRFKRASTAADGWGRMVESFMRKHIRSGLCGYAGQKHTSSTRAGACACFDDGWRLRTVNQALPPNRSPKDLLRGESFDQDHRAAAARAEPRAWSLKLGGCWRSRSLERTSVQQLMAQGQ